MATRILIQNGFSLSNIGGVQDVQALSSEPFFLNGEAIVGQGDNMQEAKVGMWVHTHLRA